jgi:hypothetical protein
MKRLVIYNAVALLAFYGVWFWGWHIISEHWLHFIDAGVPWSLLAVFFVSSLVALRKHSSKVEVALGSLAGAVLTWIAFLILWFFTMPFFDPMF